MNKNSVECNTCKGKGYIELNNMSIGDKLKYFRNLAGITQREVQKLTGINNENLCQMESGSIKSPAFNTIMKLAKFYNIDPALLIEEDK